MFLLLLLLGFAKHLPYSFDLSRNGQRSVFKKSGTRTYFFIFSGSDLGSDYLVKFNNLPCLVKFNNVP